MASSGPVGPPRLAGRAGVAFPACGGWGAVVSAALVLAFGALSRRDGSTAREESLRQRCSFVATLLAVGVRLWFRPFAAARRARDPGPPGNAVSTDG